MPIKKNNLLIAIIFFFLSFSNSQAINLEERNYFASIKASKANIRSGPGKNYNIRFTYNMKNIPIKVTGRYDNWNEIEDFEGEKGWISQNLLSRKRTAIVKSKKSFINVYLAATIKSRIVIKLENKVVTKLVGCKKSWCKIEVAGKKGWVLKQHIWGT
jgi:SH3-like domain-containing protein